MAQNVYDDPAFFAAYAGLARSVGGLDAAPEWPALRALLPDLADTRVVDLGCGYGWFCRWAAGAGASSVLGVDLSERMLERATTWPADDPTATVAGSGTRAGVIAYERQDLDALVLPAASFDLAYSSLVLHYLADLPTFLATVHRALVPGGALVVSVEHPIYTAPSAPQFVVADDGQAVWPLDGYLDEGPRTTDWLAPGIVKQHRTVAGYVTALLDAGFTLVHLEEWGPTEAELAAHPDWSGARARPPFLLLGARRG